MSHQLPVYMVGKLDPGSQATNAMYQPWTKMFSYAFPPIQSNTSGIVEAKERRDHNDIGGTNMAKASKAIQFF